MKFVVNNEEKLQLSVSVHSTWGNSTKILRPNTSHPCWHRIFKKFDPCSDNPWEI